MVGIDQLSLIVGVLADVINVSYKLVNGGGIFSAFPLMNDLAVLKTVQKAEVFLELQDLSDDEKNQLLAIFKAKLSLENVALEGKIEAGAGLLNGLVDLGYQGYDLFLQGEAFAGKVKALFQ